MTVATSGGNGNSNIWMSKMSSNEGLDLAAREIAGFFTGPEWASRFPPILTIEQAAELLQLPVETLRGWRSRGLLDSCSRRVGKRVRFLRDRLVEWYFNEARPGG